MSNDAIKIDVKNLAKVQRAMRSAIQKLEPAGTQGAVAFATLGLHRFMTAIVHVRTGRLKNSLFPEVTETQGRIFTNVNYAPYEEARGGEHAFMTRTEKEGAPGIATQTLKMFAVQIQSEWNQTA